MTLLRALMRHSVVSLKASDAKEVASSMTVIANEKLKAEKDAAAGKKKTGNCSLPICAGMCKVGEVCCKIVVVALCGHSYHLQSQQEQLAFIALYYRCVNVGLPSCLRLLVLLKLFSVGKVLIFLILSVCSFQNCSSEMYVFLIRWTLWCDCRSKEEAASC